MKRLVIMMLCAALMVTPALADPSLEDDDIGIDVPSAVLMEKSTGMVLYEKNAHERLSPASVTKVMTMLLVVEAIEAGTLTEDDMITCSEYAAGMGGSQIYMEPGEQMTVREALKSLTVSSANDCAVALGEHIAGSEEAFVRKMNERAAQLGMENTFFCDCTGLLEDDKHLTTAYDIALMSRELIGHDMIKQYTTIWMDTVRDGEFGLSNTNKLVRYYEGATGLKTGFTRKAMFCLSATAEREGVEYIAVVLHGETSDERFESARMLLDYAFANYELVSLRPDSPLTPIPVELGSVDVVQPLIEGGDTMLMKKDEAVNLVKQLDICESIPAPVTQGQELGKLTIYSNENLLSSIPIIAGDSVDKMGRWNIFVSLFDIMTGA